MSALSDSLCSVGVTPQEATKLIEGWTTEVAAQYPGYLLDHALNARGYSYLIENFSLGGDMTLGVVKIKDGNSGQVKLWQRKLDTAEKALGLTGSRARPLESVSIPLQVLTDGEALSEDENDSYPGFYPGS